LLLAEIPKEDEQTITVDGIEYTLLKLVPRLHALRETVAAAEHGAQ
jgi:hypothetical protein